MAQGGGYTFSQVPTAEIPRSSFNRSHGHKTTFDSGYLIPIYVDEALPGDTFNLKASLFARLATPIVPIMDNLHLEVFFFAVPNRLVWQNWQRFCGEQPDPGDSIDFLVPQVHPSDAEAGFLTGSIFDYFGIPTNVGGIVASALFSRAYNLIYNEWFRDENLIPRAIVNVGDGPDDADFYPLQRRGKRHDYFTSCLPWPQKGPGVELPVGGMATVVTDGSTPTFRHGVTGDEAPFEQNVNQSPNVEWNGPATFVDPNFQFGSTTGLVADLSTSTAVTINSLRQAFQIQKLLERDARGGTRYVEILKSHFGVTSPDARLQRPEFLGGGSIPVNINPVTQTSRTEGTAALGDLAGYGIAAGSGFGFNKSFVEHCVILGLCMVRADLSYQQGLPKMFSRRTRYDFYWPAFSHLGEQAVLQREIFATGTEQDDVVFGYQERWAEYRYFPSKITGKFRSDLAAGDTSLDFWHLAQDFAAAPVLNKDFIEEHPPVERVVAVVTEPQFIFDSHFKIKCTRPMPTYSVPGMIDHF